VIVFCITLLSSAVLVPFAGADWDMFQAARNTQENEHIARQPSI